MTSENTTPTAEQVEELFSAVEEALIDFATASARGDHAQHWNALRIRSDGEIYTSTEPSACYSESEYYKRVPHTLTITSKSGDCYAPGADSNWAWAKNPDGRYIGQCDAHGLCGPMRDGSGYEVVENLSEENLADKLAAGWKRFDLDLTDWCGDRPEADLVQHDWRDQLQAWIDAGNFRPTTA